MGCVRTNFCVNRERSKKGTANGKIVSSFENYSMRLLVALALLLSFVLGQYSDYYQDEYHPHHRHRHHPHHRYHGDDNGIYYNSVAAVQAAAPPSQDFVAAKPALQMATAQSATTAAAASSNSDDTLKISLAVLFSVVAVGFIGTLVYFKIKRNRQSGSKGKIQPNLTKCAAKTNSDVVTHAYTKTLPDEVDLRVGDFVVVLANYDDGWSKGTNTTTGKTGSFPFVCLSSAPSAV